MLLAVRLLVAPAGLSSPSAPELVVARRLYAEANALEQKHEWAAAERKLLEVTAIKATPGILYHLAYCAEQQGRLVEALLHYARADDLIDSGIEAVDVRRLLGPKQEELSQRIARLTLRVTPPATAVTVQVDGVAVADGLAASAIPLDPGAHHIRVLAEGRAPLERQVRLEEGQSLTVAVDLDLAPPAPTRPSQRATEMRAVTASSAEGRETETLWSSPRHLLALSGGAVTLAGVGMGVAFGLRASGSAEDAEVLGVAIEHQSQLGRSDCTSPTGHVAALCADLRRANDMASSSRWLSTASFIGAGATAVATTALFLLWKPDRGNSAAASPSAPSVSVLPLDRGLGVSASGRF